MYGYFLDAVKLQVLDNLLFVLDKEVCLIIWLSLYFTVFMNQLLNVFIFKVIVCKYVFTK